ncbi:MAG: hypothetical protein IPN79_08275 [Saprospiraceae bacterium]|nr:hypothetical protein [Saprospiraceae bacterium]
MRQLLSIIAGLSTAFLIIVMANMIREGLYPTPDDLDFSDKNKVEAWFATLPPKSFIITAIGYALAAFSSGFISSLVSGINRFIFGLISVSVVFVTGVIFLFTYNYPTWFVISDIVAMAILGFIGVILGGSRYNS